MKKLNSKVNYKNLKWGNKILNPFHISEVNRDMLVLKMNKHKRLAKHVSDTKFWLAHFRESFIPWLNDLLGNYLFENHHTFFAEPLL